MVFIITVVTTVKTGNNMDVVSVVVKWAFQYVMSALCAVSKRSFRWKEMFLYSSWN